MVSYTLDCPMHQLIKAVTCRFYSPGGEPLQEEEEAFLWIGEPAQNNTMVREARGQLQQLTCLLSTTIAQASRQVEYQQLREVLRGCLGTLVLLDGRCQVLSRLLVLYELVIHYTELLLLMKQWEPAHHMA
ncbi:hypothetical protein HaLaN_29986, partial [Haematococcus lacustris]